MPVAMILRELDPFPQDLLDMIVLAYLLKELGQDHTGFE